MKQARQQRQAGVARGGRQRAEQGLEIILRNDKQRRAENCAIERAHAADHHNHQHRDLDRTGQRRFGPDVAQPERIERAGEGCAGGGEAGRQRAVEDDAVAERLGAERVLADRFEHPPERRIDDAQQRQEQNHAGEEDEIIADQPSVDGDAEQLAVH